MQTHPAIVLFTRDLRLRDNPALAAALASNGTVVPMFVLEDRLLAGPAAGINRVAFLLQALQELRSALRRRGGDLFVRRGDTVAEVIRMAREAGADSVFCADDVSGYAARLRRRLAGSCRTARLKLTMLAGITVVPAGQLRPAGGADHYRVFTPYLRAWLQAPRRPECPAPAVVKVPPGLPAGALPRLSELAAAAPSGGLPRGGEEAGRRRLAGWLSAAAGYGRFRDDLAADQTSRLSPYLHFGCLSPVEVLHAAGADEFARQLAWRDFFHQVTAAFPAITSREYRPSGEQWRDDSEALAAWQHGQTGVPIVDAGMRQLIAEGWMHNRARLVTASFLCRQLRIDWRQGARHFMTWLADGDIACNYGNWQWVAGTGNNPRPGRVLSPLRQAARFDPDGSYVRRYVPELADLDAPLVHRPWTAPAGHPARRRYPPPLAGPG